VSTDVQMIDVTCTPSASATTNICTHINQATEKAYNVNHHYSFEHNFRENSPAFTARRVDRHKHSADYAVARCLSVCPSVCLSATRWYSVDTAELLLASLTILVFSYIYQTRWQYTPTGTPLTEAWNAGPYRRGRGLMGPNPPPLGQSQ